MVKNENGALSSDCEVQYPVYENVLMLVAFDKNDEGIYREGNTKKKCKTCRGPRVADGPSCDDQDVCMSDVCSPITGACSHSCDSNGDCAQDE